MFNKLDNGIVAIAASFPLITIITLHQISRRKRTLSALVKEISRGNDKVSSSNLYRHNVLRHIYYTTQDMSSNLVSAGP